MFKKFAVFALVISLFTLGAVVVYAQGGNGNGRGGGPAAPGNGTTTPGTCIDDPQLNAYNNGGMGFVNPDTGASWNGQQRGQMNRGAGQNGTGFYASLPPAVDGELPQDIIDLMVDGWMDEQHAYAAYESIMTQFGEVAPFVNVQRAETQHIAAWELLFDRYGITVPEAPVFDIPVFASLQEACALGADAEIANFDLYDTMLIAFEDYPDIYQIALSLRNASEFSHLPAFQACAG